MCGCPRSPSARLLQGGAPSAHISPVQEETGGKQSSGWHGESELWAGSGSGSICHNEHVLVLQ